MDRRRLGQWLALADTPGLGLMTAHELLRDRGSIEALFNLSHVEFAELAGLSLKLVDRLYTNAELIPGDLSNWLEQPQCDCITYESDFYPLLLRQIADPPLILFVQGNPSVLNRNIIALVGSRNPTPEGKELAYRFAYELTACGLTVVSGLALGIDGLAHEGSLAVGGDTIAVTGNGLDTIYPRQHRSLAKRIITRGALVSEFLPGMPPLKQNFPRRNRIISGLGLGVLVVEAAARSGSLITARLAGEQGREVFALPGPIGSPLSKGCHCLIRQGAKLTENVEDILEELNISRPQTRQQSEDRGNKESIRETGLLKYFGHTAVAMDTLVNRSGLTPDRISSMLLQLELSGEIAFGPDGLYRRSKQAPN